MLNKKNVFLIDGIGALVSSLMLGIVLPLFHDFIGISLPTLFILAGIAVVFIGYSLSCHFIKPVNWLYYLKGITYANLLYCLLTAILVILNFEQITLWGILYFSGEILLICLLVNQEMKLLKTGEA